MNEDKLPANLERLRELISKDVAEVVSPFLTVLERHEKTLDRHERRFKKINIWLWCLTIATILIIFGILLIK